MTVNIADESGGGLVGGICDGVPMKWPRADMLEALGVCRK